MKKKRQKVKKQKSLFSASDIANLIQDAIRRDLTYSCEDLSLQCKDPIQHAKARQCEELLKKFDAGVELKDRLEAEAFEDFLSTNRRLENVDLKLPHLQVSQATSVRDLVLLRARSLWELVLPDFDESEWFAECRNSAGSSVGVSFTDTSPEEKFRFPISVTAGAKPAYEKYFLYDQQLCRAVLDRNLDPVTGLLPEPTTIVSGSRATTVNKTSKKRRFIAKEPTGNMFLQQGQMAMFYRIFERIGLNVKSLPTLHRHLARLSSISGRNATVDWEQASNCVMYKLVEWFSPRDWFAALVDTRSPTTEINGRHYGLNMFATMGNAVTFPLETLVFWTIAVAAEYTIERPECRSMFLPWNYASTSSVFGDDCIVPGPVASLFIEVVESVGFIVNSEKSFYGPERFRESCGGDYLNGYDVRPFNLRAPTSEKVSALEPWLYTVLNAMLPRYISYFGTLRYVYKRELFRLLFDLMSKHGFKLKVVPRHYPDDSGAKIGFDLDRLLSWYESIELAPIYRDPHGSTKFTYCRFVYYSEDTPVHEGIRYNMWLKKPIMSEREPMHEYKERRVGGYVVGSGLTGHFGPLSEDKFFSRKSHPETKKDRALRRRTEDLMERKKLRQVLVFALVQTKNTKALINH
jgi:hypothetical protein